MSEEKQHSGLNDLDKAILAVQKAVSKVKKTEENSHLKNKYATLEDCLDALNPYLIENNLIVNQYTTYMNEVGWVLTTAISNAQQVRIFSTPLLGLDDGRNKMQSLGSAITYARRYALMSFFKLTPSDDDAEQATQIDMKQILEKLIRAFRPLGVSKKDIESYFQTDVEHFTDNEINELRGVYQKIKSGEEKNKFFPVE